MPRGRARRISVRAAEAATAEGAGKCGECACDDFKSHPFKKGVCNNCFHVHPGAMTSGESHGKVRLPRSSPARAPRCAL